MSKINPITLRAASLTLTGSLAVVVGTVGTDNANATSGAASIGSLQSLRVVCNYARHASSTTGRPVFEVDVSLDAPTTAAASVANWLPAMLLDNSTFAAGRIDGYAMQVSLAPSATGTTVSGTPPIDVSGAHWIRLRAYDVDGSNPGAISAVVFGGET